MTASPLTVRLTAAVLGLSVLTGCAQDGNQKEQIGTLLGAGLGALAGSKVGSGKGQLIGVAVGALAGAYIGGEIGKSLDAADRARMESATQYSLEHNPVGRASTWSNPDSGNSGSVTPTRTYQTAENAPCRSFENTVVVDGQEETIQGEACRQPDGSWRIVQ